MKAFSNVSIGQVVRSKRGRDAGKYFVVVGQEQEYVFLADGSLRKIEAPKKKNIKHIQITGICLPEETACAGAEGQSLSNREIRRGLRELEQRD